jgi:hypothetical protein
MTERLPIILTQSLREACLDLAKLRPHGAIVVEGPICKGSRVHVHRLAEMVTEAVPLAVYVVNARFVTVPWGHPGHGDNVTTLTGDVYVEVDPTCPRCGHKISLHTRMAGGCDECHCKEIF